MIHHSDLFTNDLANGVYFCYFRGEKYNISKIL